MGVEKTVNIVVKARDETRAGFSSAGRNAQQFKGDVEGGGPGGLKGLKGMFGRGSELGMLGATLKGGGALIALRLIGDALDNMNVKAKTFALEWAAAGHVTSEMVEELMRAVPIWGQFWKGAENVSDLWERFADWGLGQLGVPGFTGKGLTKADQDELARQGAKDAVKRESEVGDYILDARHRAEMERRAAELAGLKGEEREKREAYYRMEDALEAERQKAIKVGTAAGDTPEGNAERDAAEKEARDAIKVRYDAEIAAADKATAERIAKEREQADKEQAQKRELVRKFADETDSLESAAAAKRLELAGKTAEAELLIIRDKYARMRDEVRRAEGLSPADRRDRLRAIAEGEAVDIAGVGSAKAAQLARGGVKSGIMSKGFTGWGAGFDREQGARETATNTAKTAKAVEDMNKKLGDISKTFDFFKNSGAAGGGLGLSVVM